MTRVGQQKGFILMPVVLAIVLIATLAFLLNNQNAINVDIIAAETEARQVAYVTAAGMQHAKWQLQQQGCGPFSDISSQTFDNHSYSATITPNTGNSITSYTISVTDDAWINDATPTQNYGSDAELSAYKTVSPSSTRRTLYRFDIASAGIPVGATVVSAVAKIFVTNTNETGPVTVHQATADWSEATVNWDNINTGYDSSALATIPADPPVGQYVLVNITPLVQGWINGSTVNQGIMLLSDIFLDTAKFSSKEYANASQRPLLEITTTSSTPPNRADISVTGTLASGISQTLSRSEIPLYQPASSSSIQLEAGNGKDTTLSGFYNSRNYGGDNLRVSLAAGSPSNALLQFDVAAIPVAARVISAQLQLYHTVTTTAGSDAGATVHRVNRDWVEGTQIGDGTADGASWDTWDGSANWNTAGGDYDLSVGASSVITAATGDWESWDIKTLVQDWIDGSYPNNGLLFKGSGSVDVRFASKENADPALHPKLTITYACECGSTCLAPQGAGNLLLVVVNPTTMVPADATKKALFESWGYTVAVLSESATQIEIDTAVSNNDVVYVSNTVNSNQLGTRLAGAPIGVISEEGDYNADFGTSSSASYSVGKDMDVIDTSHYITALFPTGMLPIYSANMENLLASGTLATELQILGSDFYGAPALVVVATGGLLADGSSTAAGRRVVLPIGRDGNFNWDYLNNNGRLLVQRALQWGTGNTGAGPTGPTAHWRLDETTGTIVVDSVGGHDGTLSGATWSSGLFDGALGFNAISDYVDLGADPTLDNIFDSGATVTAWINPAGWGEGGFGRILDKADSLGSNRNGWAFELYGSQQALFFQHGFSGGIGDFQTPTGSISLDTWQHVAIVFDNSSDLNDPLLYIDGVAQTVTETSTPSGTRLSDSGITLTMGNYFIDFSRTFDGLLDDVRIYDRMLTDTEIAELAVMPALTPLAHWKLDDATGTIAVDSVGGHDGTLAGNPTWATGTLGGALDFDGAGDRVDVGPILDAGAPQISVMSWVFKRDTGDDCVISKSSGGAIVDHIFSLGVAGTTIRARLRTTDNGGTSDYDGGTIPLDQWVHLAFTYDGGTLRIYMDGTETASYAVTGDMIASTLDVAIGNVNAIDDRYWNGRLDDVRIYDRALDPVEITDLAAQGGGGGGSGSPPVFEEFTEAALGSNGSSLTISKPAGTVAGDLLIAAVATDGNNNGSLAPPAGWNVVHVADNAGKLTFGVWWKVAGASESSSYTFSWSNDERAYGWIMRFTGSDPSSPVEVISNDAGASAAPPSPSVVTTIANSLILRLGGFDHNVITAGAPGLSGHTVINMNSSDDSNFSASGGSGYLLQAVAGDSGASSFTLTKSQEYVTVTIGIAPAP